MLAGVNCLAGDLILGLLSDHQTFPDVVYARKQRKTTIKMAYEVIMVYHLHMPLYF